MGNLFPMCEFKFTIMGNLFPMCEFKFTIMGNISKSSLKKCHEGTQVRSHGPTGQTDETIDMFYNKIV